MASLTQDIKMKFRKGKLQNVYNQVLLNTLIIFSLFWISGAEEEMVCMHGVRGFAGVTWPSGDITLKEGDTLDVFCSVNLTHPRAKGYNASNLRFTASKHGIPQHKIQTSIVNETTIRLQAHNMTSSIVYLECSVQRKNGTHAPVCQNHVEVGFPPLQPTDFNCIAWNWTKLVCTWTNPSNIIKTKYNVSFTTRVGQQTFENFCPQVMSYANGTSSCEWYRGEPQYRPNERSFTMRLNGTNALNKTGVVWTYHYHHFAIVVPEPPKIVLFTALSSSRLHLNYTFKNFESFPPGLEHEAVLCSYGCEILKFTTKAPTYFFEREIEDLYPYTEYTVTIRMRSLTANKTELFWSAPVSATTTTLAKIPEMPPTNIGSFELYHDKSQQRDIYVYWDEVHVLDRNGPNFHYEAILYENGLKMDILPKEDNRSYTKFVNLEDKAEYMVQIYSVNDLGRSVEYTTINISASQKGICNTDTNLTAKVRAIATFEDNEDLFREWSQDGYVSCIGEGSWFTWTTISIVCILVLVATAFGTVKCWSCCKEMNNFEVKLPPGLQNELNPFSQAHRGKRKNSIEDVQSYGKENMTAYPMKYTPSSNADEESGILPSTKNNIEAEDCLIDCVDTRMLPQSALNPLLDHSTTNDEEDTLQPERNRLPPPADPYTKIGNSVQLPDSNRTESVSPVPLNYPVPTPPKNNETTTTINGEDDFSNESPGSSSSTLSPHSPEKPTTSRIVPDVITNNAASYVKWTQLPDFKNETITTRQSSPYCQVGVIM